jgi:hypothetical protein
MDFGQEDAIRDRQELAVDFGAADHRHPLARGERQCLVARMGDLHAVALPVVVAGQHDMLAAGEQARQAFEGLAPHDHRRAHRRDLD